MPNPAPGFAARPAYHIGVTPETGRVQVSFGGVRVADSSHALRLEEEGHAPVHYIPEQDVRRDLLRPTQHHTRCPYKGEASYWTIEVPEAGGVRRAENAVWSYQEPYDEMQQIRGYYAFYGSRVDAISVT
jgi:uncharacterized protein (DUF427 family)